jgi:dipeptidyl aminopeptidase/acylaminoacyl peptidase
MLKSLCSVSALAVLLLAAPAPTDAATAPRSDDGVARADATRVAIARVRSGTRWDAAAFPLVTEFQDPRVRVEVPSPDGRRQVWRGQNREAYWLYVSAVGAGSARKLVDCRDGYQPVWSPDSKRILFTAMDWKKGERNLYIYDVTKGGKPRLAFKSWERLGALAVWSPDGRKILFNYYGNLWLMNSNGIGRSLLDLASRIGRPIRDAQRIAWNRDGSSFVYQMRGDPKIYTVDLAVGLKAAD